MADAVAVEHEPAPSRGTPGAPKTLPPLTVSGITSVPPGHYLPVSLTPLLGRAAEVAGARSLLRSAAVRLLTLTGPGGIGKTRLALDAVSGLLDDFPQGIVFVGLATTTDPTLVAPAVAHALGIQSGGDRPLAEEIVRALRSRRLLLVLDNFEHLLPAAPLVAFLLAACARLKVLVTSRAALRLSGEHELAVQPLALPPAATGRSATAPEPEAIADYAAVALFVERARAVRPDFRLTRENARQVAEICARLDGLPLAIELAAARVRLLPPAALLARLGRRLALLTGGPRNLPARQRTLRDTLDWSYALLPAPERSLLARLGVFVGPFYLSAAEAAGSPAGLPEVDVMAALDVLVQNHLVQRIEPPAAPEAPADTVAMPSVEPRFVLLETVREYALDRLAERGEGAAVHFAHAAHFLEEAVQAAPELRGRQQGAWLARLHADAGNLRAAGRWWIERARGDAEAGTGDTAGAAGQALRFGAALWRFYQVAGELVEGRRCLADILSLPLRSGAAPAQPDETDSRLDRRAEVALGAGVLAMTAGDFAGAREYCQAALTGWRAIGAAAGVASALLALGEVDMHLARYGQARDQLARSVAACRDLGDRRLLGWPLSTLGYVACEQGDHGAAQAALDESVALFREHGEPLGLARSLHLLGVLAEARGRPGEAQACYAESLTIRRDLADAAGAALSLEGLAGLAALRGHAAPAARLAGAATALREAVGASLFPALRTRLERRLGPVRAALGLAAFDAATAAGRSLSLAAAAGAALEEAPDAPPRPAPATAQGGRRHPLTARELEVATLVSQGLTNRQIGQRLIITPGTAGVHVEHILDKLGFQSRVQIAAWTAEQGLRSAPA